MYTIEFEDGQALKRLGKVCVVIGILLALIIAFWMWGMPKYRVYEQTLIGEAELARAAQNRQIATLEAQAKKEAATLLGEAEVARAKGVAEANKIIGESLHNNEAYLRYLWINGLSEHGNAPTVVYVPTEAGLPILEAGRMNGK